MKTINFNYKIVYLIVFLIFFTGKALPKSFDLPMPWQTKLVKEDINEGKKSVSGILQYNSILSRERVIDFYKRHFSSKGFTEDNKNSSSDTLIFVQNPDERVLTLLPSPEGQTNYIIGFCSIDQEVKKINEQRNNYFKLDTNLFPGMMGNLKRLDFMPFYPKLKGELEYINWDEANPPMITAGYLAQPRFLEIVNFYLNGMANMGWRLIEKKDAEGIYLIDQWLPMIAPYTSFCPHCEGKLPAEVPPLHLKGSKLIFTRRQEKCEIAVYTFDDIIEKAQGTVYEHDINMVLGRYGTTAISVVYFYKGNS